MQYREGRVERPHRSAVAVAVDNNKVSNKVKFWSKVVVKFCCELANKSLTRYSNEFSVRLRLLRKFTHLWHPHASGSL